MSGGQGGCELRRSEAFVKTKKKIFLENRSFCENSKKKFGGGGVGSRGGVGSGGGGGGGVGLGGSGWMGTMN